MATDPVRRIRRTQREGGFDTDLLEGIRRLAAFEPSTASPFLTVSLDWRPEGDNPSQRVSRDQVERTLAGLVDQHGPRGETFEFLTDASRTIVTYLDEELDPAARGVVIVTGGPDGVFESFPLAIPVATNVALAPIPYLSTLTRIKEDHPAFCVLVADQKQAILWTVQQAVLTGTLEVQGNDYPRKQSTGGWSQRRYQARADERISAFARTVASEVQQALEQEKVDALVIAGDEVIVSALDPEWHQTVRERIRGYLRLDITTPESEVLAAALPVELAGERERELETVRQVIEYSGSGGADTGAEAVLQALKNGQVRTLVLLDDFELAGWADYSMPVFGVGEPPAEHPAAGNPGDIVAVPLREEFVRLAFNTGADVEIVHSSIPVSIEPGEPLPSAGQSAPRTGAAELLAAHGGVGALLRFKL